MTLGALANNIEARASDGQFDTTPAQDTLDVQDTTDPAGDWQAWSPSDGATRPTGMVVPIGVWYDDFTDYTSAQYWYNENAGPWNGPFAMTDDGWAEGSNYHDFSFTLTLAADGFVEYYVEMVDGNGNTLTLPAGGAGAPRTLNFLTGAAIEDPYPIFGYTMYYTGTFAGGMDYNAATEAYGTLDPNSPGTVEWRNTTGAQMVEAFVSDANAQFSVDIYNYTDGTMVWINASSGTINAGFNIGNNVTLIDILAEPGGAREDVIIGVPYNLTWIAVPVGPVMAGVPFAADYQIVDRIGDVAMGYFTPAPGPVDGPTDFISGDPLFVNDVAHPYTWNGLVDGGQRLASVALVTGGWQWVNISEGGWEIGPQNPYLTPYGAFNVPGTAVPGYLDDWENVTLWVDSGAFRWNLVVGWNQVCVPMNPDNDGADGFFGAFDMLREVFDDTGDPASSAATRTGGNPSTYDTYDYVTANEFDATNIAFGACDYTSGYWIYATVAGVVTVQATNCSAVGDNVAALAAGWNLMGFTHNYSVGGAMPGGWNAQPTAADYTTGVIDGNLLTGGAAGWQIIATWFIQATQRYDSYVENTFFPGMAAHNWVYDTNFAYGYWIWVANGVGVTFDVEF
jgi:hypothetical protein